MEISQIAGLPAHPLLVHAAVVLVPLAAIALLLTGWRRAWRERYALPIAAIAWVGWLMSQFASGSGEALEHDLKTAARTAGTTAPKFGDHTGLGQTAAVIALGLAIMATALWVSSRWGERLKLPAWTPTAIYGAAAVVGLVATGWMVQAGHTGAQLAWDTNAGAAALLK